MRLTSLLIPLLGFTVAVLAGSCSSDYPTLATTEYSGYFDLPREQTTLARYTYYYYSATSGVPFTVTMTPGLLDLELIGSWATYSTRPTVRYSQFQSISSSTQQEAFTVTPDTTDCFVIGVGHEENIGYFSLSVTSTNGTNAYPTTDFSDESVPICERVLLNSNASTATFVNERYYSGSFNIREGEYQLIYLSTISDSSFRLSTDKGLSEILVYISDAWYIPQPNASLYDFTSAARTDEFIFYPRRCIAFAVYGYFNTTYSVTINNPSFRGSSLGAVIGLSVGIPCFFCCCFLPASIALYRRCKARRRNRAEQRGPAVEGAAGVAVPIGAVDEGEHEGEAAEEPNTPLNRDFVPPPASK